MAPAAVYDLAQYREKRRVFRDRRHGGEVLAEMLAPLVHGGDLVCALPAGGVPVAVTVAEALGLDLAAAPVSKITLPWSSEAGYGAVAFDGTERLNARLVEQFGLSSDQVAQGKMKAREKVLRRVRRLEAAGFMAEGAGRRIIVVDDGLASGMTMLTAIEAFRRAGASSVVPAVPTGHEETVATVAAEGDGACCPNIRSRYPFAVADAYLSWYDVTEEEVLDMLAAFRHRKEQASGGMRN